MVSPPNNADQIASDNPSLSVRIGQLFVAAGTQCIVMEFNVTQTNTLILLSPLP